MDAKGQAMKASSFIIVTVTIVVTFLIAIHFFESMNTGSRKIIDDAFFDPKQVAYLTFNGSDMGFEPLILKDPALIAKFLSATWPSPNVLGLQGSMGIGNGVNEMIIYYHTTNMRPTLIYFNSKDNPLAYGPGFNSALDALSKEQTAQVRQKVRAVTPQVRSIGFDASKFRITRPDEVKKLLQALTELDSHAFAFTKPHEMWRITLFGERKELIHFNLFVENTDKTGNIRHGQQPLPNALWKYFALEARPAPLLQR